MPWNWELPDWPHFKYNPDLLPSKEKKFLLGAGSAFAFLKSIDEEEVHQFIVEILSIEGIESSKIEGEILDRESLQSSIRKHFGLKASKKTGTKKESGMADVLYLVYKTFDKPLTHHMIQGWHETLMQGSTIEDIGKYRTHHEPMQIVSNRLNKVFFEAPPSSQVRKEMDRFISWFNSNTTSIIEKAAVAHVYFESIHPFEDGNGRIGRLLIEKILSQGIGRPTLNAISHVLERHKKDYYEALGACNRTLSITGWVNFMADAILEAQAESMKLLQFLINKSKLLNHLQGSMNERQEKVLLRLFKEGPEGFKGGLSAENYIAITNTSRATATRDLAELIELNALKKTGTLRHTRYWLNI